MVKLGPDQVQELYKSNPAPKAPAFYINLDNPDVDNKLFATTYGSKVYKFEKTMTEGNLKYVRNNGAPQKYASGAKDGKSCRFHISAGKNMSTPGSHSWKDKTIPEYVTKTDTCFYSSEITVIARPGKPLGTHQSFAFKMNSRPDKPDDSLRSTIEYCMSNDQKKIAYVNYNYAHSGYQSTDKIKDLLPAVKITPNKWIGVKMVFIIAPDRKSTKMQLWVNTDPIDLNTGAPKNNWQLKSEYLAKGIKQYKNIPPVWGGDSYLRIDGYDHVDLFRFSQREILGELATDDPPKPEPKPPVVIDPAVITK